MEILIPGLILVAVMVWASTKIKKRAAEAFEPEVITTERFTLRKPEGFLHVIDSPNHDFEAYSKESGEGGDRGKRATIEVDILHQVNLLSARESVLQAASELIVSDEIEGHWRIETEEAANEPGLKVVYKLVAVRDATYRLRFAVISEHYADYLRRIDETIESFAVKAT